MAKARPRMINLWRTNKFPRDLFARCQKLASIGDLIYAMEASELDIGPNRVKCLISVDTTMGAAIKI